MSIIGKIFSAAGGDLIKSVGSVVDDLVTTDEERLEAKNKIETMFREYEAQMQKEVTARWLSDNQGSWLTKTIRP